MHRPYAASLSITTRNVLCTSLFLVLAVLVMLITCTPASAIGPFTEVEGASDPFNGVDVDGDGDMDAFSGNSSGFVVFYENTGTVITPPSAWSRGRATHSTAWMWGCTALPASWTWMGTGTWTPSSVRVSAT